MDWRDADWIIYILFLERITEITLNYANFPSYGRKIQRKVDVLGFTLKLRNPTVQIWVSFMEAEQVCTIYLDNNY